MEGCFLFHVCYKGSKHTLKEPVQIEDEIQFLDTKCLKISRNSFGELVVELSDGSIHTSVVPVKAFPLTLPNQFIMLIDADNDKEEIGLIENIKDLKKASRQVLEDELEKCYFMPKIQKIHDLSGRFGVTRWEVDTDRGQAQFDLRSRYDIRSLDAGRILIKDVDGVRYEIVNYHRLDVKSIALLETQI